jgi:hypothetical protein
MPFNIRLFGDSPANRAIATGVSGSGSPTDEIFGPSSPGLTFSGTISATTGSPTVTGSGTTFTTQVQVGQMFFGFVSGIPRLLGIVTAIASNTSLTLGTNSPLTLSGVDYGAVNKINPVRKPVLMRVEVITGDDPSLFNVPELRLLRQGNTDSIGAYTDTSLIFLAQISDSGSPGEEASPVIVPCTIKRLNVVPQSGGSNPTVSYSSLPEAFWYELSAVVSTNVLTNQLASDASFEVFVESELPAYTVENDSTLYALQFSNTTGNTGGYF